MKLFLTEGIRLIGITRFASFVGVKLHYEHIDIVMLQAIEEDMIEESMEEISHFDNPSPIKRPAAPNPFRQSCLEHQESHVGEPVALLIAGILHRFLHTLYPAPIPLHPSPFTHGMTLPMVGGPDKDDSCFSTSFSAPFAPPYGRPMEAPSPTHARKFNVKPSSLLAQESWTTLEEEESKAPMYKPAAKRMRFNPTLSQAPYNDAHW